MFYASISDHTIADAALRNITELRSMVSQVNMAVDILNAAFIIDK